MRDPKRIDVMLALIEKIWKAYPDLRLMQLLLNTKAHYSTEDDVLMGELKSVYKIKHD